MANLQLLEIRLRKTPDSVELKAQIETLKKEIDAPGKKVKEPVKKTEQEPEKNTEAGGE